MTTFECKGQVTQVARRVRRLGERNGGSQTVLADVLRTWKYGCGSALEEQKETYASLTVNPVTAGLLALKSIRSLPFHMPFRTPFRTLYRPCGLALTFNRSAKQFSLLREANCAVLNAATRS